MELQNIGLGILSMMVLGIIFIFCMVCGYTYSIYYDYRKYLKYEKNTFDTEGVKILSYKYDGRCTYINLFNRYIGTSIDKEYINFDKKNSTIVFTSKNKDYGKCDGENKSQCRYINLYLNKRFISVCYTDNYKKIEPNNKEVIYIHLRFSDYRKVLKVIKEYKEQLKYELCKIEDLPTGLSRIPMTLEEIEERNMKDE